MVNFCCIHGCGHRASRDQHVNFYRIPSISEKRPESLRILTQRRRSEWLRQICRKTITEKTFKSWHRVCSRHFVTGKPSDLQDPSHPDWIPTLHLGHNQGKTANVDTFQRALARRNKKELYLTRVTATSQEDGGSLAPDIGDIQIQGEPMNENVTLSSDIGTQTDLTYENIAQLECVAQDLTTENALLKEKLSKKLFDKTFFEKNDDKVTFYTGLPNFAILLAVFNMLSINIVERPNSMLTKFQQVMIALLKLRLNLPMELIADLFWVSQSTVRRTFTNILDIMYVQFQPLVKWPNREDIRATMPAAFLEHFGRKITVIIDCFEVKMQRASNLQARNQTYSHYKSGNTMKVLIGITPQGVISFVSKAWGGRTSDKCITEQSSFLDNLEVGDVILADRGFNIHESAGLHCAEVILPAFTRGKKQLSGFEVESTRRIANVRIHVERVIGLLRRKYTMLDSVIPLSQMLKDSDNMTVFDKIVFVSCALVNLCPSVVL